MARSPSLVDVSTRGEDAQRLRAIPEEWTHDAGFRVLPQRVRKLLQARARQEDIMCDQTNCVDRRRVKKVPYADIHPRGVAPV
jgi:hypothetical protein